MRLCVEGGLYLGASVIVIPGNIAVRKAPGYQRSLEVELKEDSNGIRVNLTHACPHAVRAIRANGNDIRDCRGVSVSSDPPLGDGPLEGIGPFLADGLSPIVRQSKQREDGEAGGAKRSVLCRVDTRKRGVGRKPTSPSKSFMLRQDLVSVRRRA